MQGPCGRARWRRFDLLPPRPTIRKHPLPDIAPTQQHFAMCSKRFKCHCGAQVREGNTMRDRPPLPLLADVRRGK
jgi:hypothetical protein